MQNIPNRFYRISIKGLILDESRTKFLLLQEDNGKWDLPGGGLDWGETSEIGLRREIQEEMGLAVTKINPTPCYFTTGMNAAGDMWVANVLFEVQVEHLNFTPSKECVDLRFVTSEEAKSLETFQTVIALADIFDPKNHQLG